MARDSSAIEADIASIRAAIARGVVRVRHGETETVYHSLSEMRKALEDLLAELAAVTPTAIKQLRFKTSKGLD